MNPGPMDVREAVSPLNYSPSLSLSVVYGVCACAYEYGGQRSSLSTVSQHHLIFEVRVLSLSLSLTLSPSPSLPLSHWVLRRIS